MKLNKIIEDYVVSDQIQADDIALLKQHGFQTIFCNRPDSEEPNQPSATELEKIAKALEINFIHQPVIGNAITQKDVSDFKSHYVNAQKPIFAYCRTGTRSSMLWALSESSDRSSKEILELTASAGYDLSTMLR
jgi:uncharacterized protein (TIGR01244 family)